MKESEMGKKNKEIEKLRKELQEQKGMNWILGQIIKKCGNLDSFERLMNITTDMLMGVIGLDSCTIWIKNKKNFNYYSRSVYEENGMVVGNSNDLPEYLIQMDKVGVFELDEKRNAFIKGEKVKSVLLAPLNDFSKGKSIGLIVGEHSSENFFTKSKVDFFETLAIQISIAAENSKLFQKISDLSNKDILTNCFNRKYLNELMKKIEKDNIKYTLAIFDLDNFKKINDNYGHEKGDQVLIAVSDLALEYMKIYGGDVIRYGGDEFILIIYSKLDEAMSILEKFRNDVNNTDIIKNMNVTVTIGVSYCDKGLTSMKDIFSAADNALLDAKKTGKNIIKIGSCV